MRAEGNKQICTSGFRTLCSLQSASRRNKCTIEFDLTRHCSDILGMCTLLFHVLATSSNKQHGKQLYCLHTVSRFPILALYPTKPAQNTIKLGFSMQQPSVRICLYALDRVLLKICLQTNILPIEMTHFIISHQLASVVLQS